MIVIEVRIQCLASKCFEFFVFIKKKDRVSFVCILSAGLSGINFACKRGKK